MEVGLNMTDKGSSGQAREFVVRNPDPRYEYAQRWFKRSITQKNPFDTFFYLWIALIIAARYGTQREPEDNDGNTVKEYFRRNSNYVLSVMSKEARIIAQLCARRGTERGMIVETYGQRRERRRGLFDKFACAYDDLTDQEKVETLAEIINQVRNNLFHGRKVYNDKQDRELLELVNPLISSVITTIEQFHH